MTALPDRPFLTVDEAAQLLGISGNQLVTAIETGKVPAIRLGESHRATRIYIEELIPGDGRRRELREQRLRSLVRKVSHAREDAMRAESAAAEARQRLDAALHDLADAIEIGEEAALLRKTG